VEFRNCANYSSSFRYPFFRSIEPTRRKDGSYIRFDENAVVIIEKTKKEPIAGRIFGPIPREIGEAGFKTIASKAPEIV
jgi:large subunit ribosomal protein L14